MANQWHQMEMEETLRALATDANQGLSESEAERRRPTRWGASRNDHVYARRTW